LLRDWGYPQTRFSGSCYLSSGSTCAWHPYSKECDSNGCGPETISVCVEQLPPEGSKSATTTVESSFVGKDDSNEENGSQILYPEIYNLIHEIIKAGRKDLGRFEN
jgi:hypothetical protein